MWGAVFWDFFSCCTTRDRDSDHLVPVVPPAGTRRSLFGRGGSQKGERGVPSEPAPTPSSSSYWSTSERKSEPKAESANHVGLKEVSSSQTQIYMLKEQVRLLQRHNEQLMSQSLPTQTRAPHAAEDEDLVELKSQLSELKSRNAQLEDELSSQGSQRSATYHRRSPKVQRSAKNAAVPARKRTSLGAPTVNVAAAAAQVARRGLLSKKRTTAEDGKKCVDLTEMRPPPRGAPRRVRTSTLEVGGEEGETDPGEDICDLTALRERQSLLGLPPRK